MDSNDSPVIMETDLPLPVFIRGKVRDTYDLGSHLLIVATDRISAFDVVLPTGIPLKGHVLNRLSSFWFRRMGDIIPNHMTEALDNVHSLDSYVPAESRFAYPSYLRGRSMVVKKVKRLPLECVVRGYLSGSAWAEYKQKGTVSGKPMPVGLQESQEMKQPLFTPTTKADTGHDEPVTKEYIVKLFGLRISQELEDKSLALYKSACEYALGKGIIIADTKFEFGIDNGRLILIDEALTPDSSRFWDASRYKAGQTQDSLDKQPVRDWLTASGWNKEPPAPALPPDVVQATSKRYVLAYERITGRQLAILE
ncbi:MAG: phosphoribosylaminoimidazolesuccinocarboxamide synthase [Chloroflexi bacterium RBG_13_52_12]|nr:MAG: phosphoribosylaminoimidazolesuccinocarboxamide synthase [Chloroflexi bacterium RBG_13_52_12]